LALVKSDHQKEALARFGIHGRQHVKKIQTESFHGFCDTLSQQALEHTLKLDYPGDVGMRHSPGKRRQHPMNKQWKEEEEVGKAQEGR
jgi:hypothetical protein